MEKLAQKPSEPGQWIDITTFDDLAKGELVELNTATGEERKSRHPLIGDSEESRQGAMSHGRNAEQS